MFSNLGEGVSSSYSLIYIGVTECKHQKIHTEISIYIYIHRERCIICTCIGTYTDCLEFRMQYASQISSPRLNQMPGFNPIGCPDFPRLSRTWTLYLDVPEVNGSMVSKWVITYL